jgi:hypothetical protein
MPFWEDVYRKAFPSMIGMFNHRADGQHQRNGIDRSIVLDNSKQVLIDEKVRGRNAITGKVYDDIALEYVSDDRRNEPGWVCKPLLCDYIAYAIAPLGRCYLLPVVQLQEAWNQNGDRWLSEASRGEFRRIIVAKNRSWNTLSVNVTVSELFSAIGSCLRVEFESCEVNE